MATVSTAHGAVGTGNFLRVADGQSYTHTVTGTFVGTWVVEYTKDYVTYVQVATGTGTSSATTVVVEQQDSSDIFIRSRMSAYTSGTCTVALADVADAVSSNGTFPVVDADGTTLMDAVDGSISTIVRTGQKKIITAGAKAGGTAGWAVDAANDKGSLAKCPASQTASTLVVKIPDLKVGDTITGIGVVGQLESAGNTATLDCILRAQTAVAGDNTDAAIGSGITQISKTADYLINDEETGLTETVSATKGYYLLLTATTAAATDIDLLNVFVTVTEG